MSDLQCPVTLRVVTADPVTGRGEVAHVPAASPTATSTLDDLADLHRGETVVVVTDDVPALVLLLTGRATTADEAFVEGDADGWRLVVEPG